MATGSPIKREKRYLYIPIVLLAIFFAIALGFINRSASNDIKQFQTHSKIISDDIWALNDSGASSYLQLALQANHYKKLSVSIPGNDTFIELSSPPLTGLNYFLHRMQLMPLKTLQNDIVHKDLIIGKLTGEQYVRVIFPLINLFIFFLLLLLICLFIIALFINRNRLEDLVLERTRNLRESERRFHDLVNLLPEMVLETDTAGRILYANKTAKERLQLDNFSEPPTLFEFLPKETQHLLNANFKQAMLVGRMGLREVEAIDAEGNLFPVLVRSSPIQHNGKVVGSRMIAVDITERRRLEEELHRDQKMKAIGLMAGGVAHDLNNILSGIISYPELLLLDLEPDNPMRKPLEAIQRSGLDASDVVSDLLTVARGIAASKERVHLNTLIRDYFSSPDFEQLKHKYPEIVFNVSLADTLDPVSCSPIHVRKCLMNLIINGLEAITGSGSLTIHTIDHNQEEDQVRNLQTLKEGHYIKVRVQDSGSGISAQEIEHIFEPFYTKKVMGRSGTGLGLAIVWNTMRDHGGIVDVFSTPEGTTFDLYFPSAPGEEADEAAPTDWRNYRGNKERVLVVDDEPRQREITQKLLMILNFKPEAVHSGEEAVKYINNHNVDIIILDMIMPPGMNGRQTYEQILAINPDQKAIIASGYAENEDVRAALAMGAGAFIAKPFTLEQLGSAIFKTLYESS